MTQPITVSLVPATLLVGAILGYMLATLSPSPKPTPKPTTRKPKLTPKSTPKPTYHLRYMNELLKLDCAPELLALKIFPDAKEVSESFSMYEALYRHVGINEIPVNPINDLSSYTGDNVVLVVGDGSTPRIGALCAFMLGKKDWVVYSVDPQMRPVTHPAQSGNSDKDDPSSCYSSIKNLRVVRGFIEDVSIHAKKVIIVMMHCHVTLSKVLESIHESTQIDGIVCCSCCNWSNIISAPLQHQ